MPVSRLVQSVDDEPVVIIDDDASRSASTQSYLHSVGVSAATAAAFRVGAVDDATLTHLCPGLRRLTGVGVNMPTFDPRHPDVPVGVIRLTPAQHLHRFMSAPAGLACASDLDQRKRVVLCDNPLMAMRLYEAGVVDVALVEDPAVIASLHDWFAAREVVLLSTKTKRLADMQSALGTSAHGLIIPAALDRLTDDVRALLGIEPKVVQAAPITPLSLVTVRDLYEYAVRQLETAEGRAALRAAELDHPDVIAAYHPGYLPARYRDILPVDQRAHFAGGWHADSLVLAALDERSVIVDLMSLRPSSNHSTRSLWPEPRGLFAPVLSTAFDHLVVTDVPRRIGRLSRNGTPALLLRGPADAQANAARLAASGVRSIEVRAHHDAEAIGTAFTAVGISVNVVRNPYGRNLQAMTAQRRAALIEESDDAQVEEVVAAMLEIPPSVEVGVPVVPSLHPTPTITLPTLALVEHDRQGERAVFMFGAGTYAVTIPHRPTSTLSIIVTGPKRSQLASFDLAVADARKRNGAMLALSTGLAGPEVASVLVALLPAVLALIEPRAPATAPLNPTTVPMRADERDDAMGLLKANDLESRMVMNLGVLGADAEDPATTIAMLAAISRLGERPLWAALTATMPSERFPALSAIAQATPPDQAIHVTRLTAEALNHHDPEALRHKLLILGDATEISERAATSLRLFHDRGVLATTTVERSTQHGGLRTRVVEVRGPIAVLAATTGALPHGLDHHLFSVPVDDSPDAQIRQRQAEDQRMVDPATLAAVQRRRADAVRRLHNAQRLLVPRQVAIPDLATIALPAALARNRLHHDALIGLIQASALLHQHQRPMVEGCLVATSADTDCAIRLLHYVATRQSAGLSPSAHCMLTTLWAGQRIRFTMDDLDELLPGWTRWAYRTALDELIALDVITADRGGRGKRRAYTLVATAPRSTALRMPVLDATDEHREVTHG
ncbi:MAG: hypothetical protein AAB263_13025 [Planctomycetota bacterium]